MIKKRPNPNKSDKLRRRAERKLKNEIIGKKIISAEEAAGIIHELHAHQIELEMQNEELRRAQTQLEESRSRYADLYDFAPVGYFVLDRNGLILDLNLTGAALFGNTRDKIVNKPFNLFVAKEDRDKFYLYRREIFKTEIHQSCELKLVKKDGGEFYGLLDSLAIEDAEGNFTWYRTVISDVTEFKKAKEELQLSEERYALAQRAANIGSWDWDIETGSLHWSENIEPLFGFAQGQFGGTYEAFLECVHPEDLKHIVDSVNACVEDGKDYAIEHRIIWPNGTVRWVAETGDVIRSNNGKAIRMLGIVQDITNRKDREFQRQLAGKILECLNRESVGTNLIGDILKLIKKTTGFDAIGIRLQVNGDFPYFEVNGFPDDFVKDENHLCSHTEAGEVIYDSNGRPVLECMCGIVLSGLTDPTLPFFTEAGSFWTNSTSELLKGAIQEALQVPTRNRCNKAGYESVALIPLRSGERIVGLLQFNDTRKGCFTQEMVQFFEEVGASIGIGLARIRIEQEVESLAKFPSENPYPVIRISKDGKVLYANSAGSDLLRDCDCTVGEQPPEKWHEGILWALNSGLNETLEDTCRDKIFSLTIAPVIDSGYVNIYGTDITKRKLAEESLLKYQQQLEELVQRRTIELTETNKKLLDEIEGRKQLEKEILNISEREQKRIGQELHDSIGQQFTGIAFMAKVLEQKLTEKLPDMATDASEIKKLVNQAMEQTRSLARGLHPVDLHEGSLIVALQELAATTETLFGIRCRLKCNKSIPIDDPEVTTHLYRITQEAVTNAIKHGKANNIQIELDHKDNQLILKVENDGLDFPEEFEARGTGMGLQIMDHRADIIGASLDIHKATNGGTILTCSF